MNRIPAKYVKFFGYMYLAYSIAALFGVLFQMSQIIEFTNQLQSIIPDASGNKAFGLVSGPLMLIIQIIGSLAVFKYLGYFVRKNDPE